jgi:V/A-type H+-transporting ATPase subunit A
MMKLIDRFAELAANALEGGLHPDALATYPCVRALRRMGEEIGNDELPLFAELAARLESEFHAPAPESRDETAPAG